MTVAQTTNPAFEPDRIDKFDPNVLIAVTTRADFDLIAGVLRCDDGSLYVWCDVPGQGRSSSAEAMPADAEAALDVMLDRAADSGAIDLAATQTHYVPELL